MKIGFDIDGVLANFTAKYIPLCIEVTGKNLFHPNDDKHPPCWLFDEYRGYTKEEVSKVWKTIIGSPDFWLSLPEEAGCSTLRLCILDMLRFHDVYFITSRPGQDSKWQTEQWLILHLGIERPTVLISSAKGLCAAALKLDCYLDDNLDNVNDVVAKTGPEQMEAKTRTYLLDKSYNQSGGIGNGPLDMRVTRVGSVGQFLDAELHNL